jgi:hypothetical protein
MKLGSVADTHLLRRSTPAPPTDKRSWLRDSYAILDIERSRVRPRLVFHGDRLT